MTPAPAARAKETRYWKSIISGKKDPKQKLPLILKTPLTLKKVPFDSGNTSIFLSENQTKSLIFPKLQTKTNSFPEQKPSVVENEYFYDFVFELEVPFTKKESLERTQRD
jgi:hypothetical protein